MLHVVTSHELGITEGCSRWWCLPDWLCAVHGLVDLGSISHHHHHR